MSVSLSARPRYDQPSEQPLRPHSGGEDERFDWLTRLSGGQYVSPLDLALLYAGLQDKERTLEQLEHAADDRVGWLINLGVEPRFQLLRSEPRYMELLRRMRLAN